MLLRKVFTLEICFHTVPADANSSYNLLGGANKNKPNKIAGPAHIVLAIKIETLACFTLNRGGLWSDLIPLEQINHFFCDKTAGASNAPILGTPAARGIGELCLRMVCLVSGTSSGWKGHLQVHDSAVPCLRRGTQQHRRGAVWGLAWPQSRRRVFPAHAATCLEVAMPSPALHQARDALYLQRFYPSQLLQEALRHCRCNVQSRAAGDGQNQCEFARQVVENSGEA